jgi:hypothetical protein
MADTSLYETLGALIDRLKDKAQIWLLVVDAEPERREILEPGLRLMEQQLRLSIAAREANDWLGMVAARDELEKHYGRLEDGSGGEEQRARYALPAPAP